MEAFRDFRNSFSDSLDEQQVLELSLMPVPESATVEQRELATWFWHTAIQSKFKSKLLEKELRIIGFKLMIGGLKHARNTEKSVMVLLDVGLKTVYCLLEADDSRVEEIMALVNQQQEMHHDVIPKNSPKFIKYSYFLQLLKARLLWKQGNSKAFFLLQNMTSDNHELVRELIITILNLAKDSQTEDKSKWLQLGLKIIESCGYDEFKRVFVTELVHVKTETKEFISAQQLLNGLDQNSKDIEVEYLEMLILQNTNQTDSLEKKFISMTEKYEFNEANLPWYMSAANLLPVNSISAIQYLENIQTDCSFNLTETPDKISHKGQVLLSTCYLITKSAVTNRIERINTQISKYGNIDVGTKLASSLMDLFWSAGDDSFTQTAYEIAIEYYNLAILFLSLNLADSRLKALLYQKIANSYVELKDYNQSLIHVQKAVGLDSRESPLNDYLLFLVYFNLNQYEQAIIHLKQISFNDRSDMWIAAAEVVLQNDNKEILLLILKAITNYSSIVDPKAVSNLFIVYRSLIVLSSEELRSNPSDVNFNEQLQTLNRLYQLCSDLDQSDPSNCAEIEWLFRTTWNESSFVHQCLALVDLQVHYFALTFKILQLIKEKSPLHVASIQTILVLLISTTTQLIQKNNSVEHIDKAFEYIEYLSTNFPSNKNIKWLEFELHCRKKDWKPARDILNEPLSFGQLEKFHNVCESVECPWEYKQLIYSKIIDSLAVENVGIEGLFKWYKELVRVLIAENKSVCYEKAAELLSLLNGTFESKDLLWITIKLWNYATDLWG